MEGGRGYVMREWNNPIFTSGYSYTDWSTFKPKGVPCQTLYQERTSKRSKLGNPASNYQGKGLFEQIQNNGNVVQYNPTAFNIESFRGIFADVFK